MYRLKTNKDGLVRFKLKHKGKIIENETTPQIAERIISKGEMLESDIEGYPININNVWYFEGENR